MVNIFRPTQQGKIISDAVTVFVDGAEIFNGWESLRISRRLDSIAHSFDLDLTDKWRQTGDRWPIYPGKKVTILSGEKLLITGYIDSLNTSFSSTSRTVSASGRSLAGDLVDCSVKDDSELNNIRLLPLINKLVGPFGISATLSAPGGDVFKKFSVKQGDTVFETIERAARARGVILISKADGNIDVVQTGAEKTVTELHQGSNIKSGSATYDNSDRFSEYIVKGQSQGSDDVLAELSTSPVGTAKDGGIDRQRPFLVIAESNVDTGKARTRAQWEATVRAAKSAQLNIEVQGWREQNDEFWDVNKLVRVKAGLLGVDDTFLIEGVDFEISNSGGKTTSLKLVRKDAYTPQPTIPASDDPILNLQPGAGTVA